MVTKRQLFAHTNTPRWDALALHSNNDEDRSGHIRNGLFLHLIFPIYARKAFSDNDLTELNRNNEELKGHP